MRIRNILYATVVAALLVLAVAAPQPAYAWGGGCGSYVVQRGDTLFSIGMRYGMTVTDMRQANPNLGYWLYAGQTISIPCGGQDGGYNGGWQGNTGGCGYQGCDGNGYQNQGCGYQGCDGNGYQNQGCGYQGCDGNGYQIPGFDGNGYQGQGEVTIRASGTASGPRLYGAGRELRRLQRWLRLRQRDLRRPTRRHAGQDCRPVRHHVVPAVRSQRAVEPQLDLRRAGPPHSLEHRSTGLCKDIPPFGCGGMSLLLPWGQRLLTWDDDPQDHVREKAWNSARDQRNQEC